MQFRILGPLEVEAGGNALALGGVKQRGVLAALLLRANETVGAERLIDLLWGEEAPASAAGTLQAYVSRLRKAMRAGADDDREGRLETVGKGYRLRIEPDEVDLLRFERLTDQGRRALERGDAVSASSLLREATSLWRGDPLADFGDMPFALPEVTRLEELRVAALEDRVAADLATGRAADLIGELTRLVEEHPLRERFRGQLMVALYRTDRQADALTVYEDGRERLADELGLDPGPQLRELHDRILRQDEALLGPAPASRPAAGGDAPARTPSPADLQPPPIPKWHTSFVGRGDEVAHLIDLLAEPGVITVTGPGGVGKSRLAIEAARAVRKQRTIVHVGLAAVEPGGAARALLEALTLEGDPGGDDVAAAARALAETDVVVVLDDGDHVADEAATLAVAIRDAADCVTVVVTCRSRLAVEGERIVELRPLSPAADGDGVALFRGRAQDVTTLPDGSGAIIEDIVAALDGLPLAIELAAARAAMLSLDELRSRLVGDLGVLGARSDGPQRHRSLDECIAWSVDELDDDEAAVLRRVAIFPAGCTVTAAECVATGGGIEATDVLDVLGRLVQRSLLASADGRDGRRYQMLRAVRSHALRELEAAGEQETVSVAFAGWASDLAERGRDGLHRPDRDAWRRRLDAEHDNLISGLRGRLDAGDGAAALAIASRLWPYWRRVGWVREGRELLAVCLEAAGVADGPEWASVRHGEGALAMLCSDFDAAKQALSDALGAATDPTHAAWIRTDLGAARLWSAEHHGADEALTEAVAAFTGLGHVPGEAAALRVLTRLKGWQGRYVEARQLGERALVLARQIDDPRAVAEALSALALAHVNLDEHDRAATHAADGVDAARPAGDRDALLLALYSQALVASVSGDRDVAMAASDEIMKLSGLLTLPGASVPALVTLARTAARDGDTATATAFYSDAIERARRAHMPENTTVCALGLARVMRRAGDRHGARAALATAASVTAEHDLVVRVGEVLDEAALQALAAGDDERARSLFSAAATALPPYLRPTNDRDERDAAVAGLEDGSGAPSIDLDPDPDIDIDIDATLAALADLS